MKINYKLTDLKICLIGLLIGLILGLIFLRGFIFSNGLAFWLDLRWEYSSSIYPNLMIWDEYIQDPVIINHLIAKAWLYLFQPEIAERLLFIVLFMIMGVSMFYSMYKITSEFKFTKNVALITSFISTVFFIINPIVAMRLGHWLLLWFYAFLPILFYFSYSSFRKIFGPSWSCKSIKKCFLDSF